MANHTKRISDEKRAEIVADIKENAGKPGGSYRDIAQRHSVANGTIQAIARANGLADRWKAGQAQTAAATSVHQSNGAERRAQLQLEFLDDVAKLREKLFGEVVHLNVVKAAGPMAGEYVEQTTVHSGPRDWRDTAGAIAALTGKAIDLARLEAEQNTGEGEGAALLRSIAESLGRKG